MTGGWTGWIDVPNWFSFENQGGGIAVADLSGDGKQDLVVFMIDNPPGLNRGIYQVGPSLDANGNVTGAWTGWIDVPDWFSWENQGAGVAVVDRGTERDLAVFAIDNPVGQNQAFYRILPSINVNGTSRRPGLAGSACPTGSPGRTRAAPSPRCSPPGSTSSPS